MNQEELERFKDILKNFNKKKILVYGDVMLDQYISGDVTRISPEAPVPIVDVNSNAYALGGSANTANNARALGCEVAVAGVIGNDENGKMLAKFLKEKGISTDCLIVDESRPTTTKTRVLSKSHYYIRIDHEKRNLISDDILAKVLSFTKNSLKNFDAIVFSDYDKGFIRPELISEVIRLARENSKPVIADPKLIHFFRYKKASIIKPNTKEASAVTGINVIDEITAQHAARKIMDDLESDAVMITRGKDGLYIYSKNDGGHNIPALGRPEIDITGAGDTTTAALAVSLAAGASYLEAAKISNFAGGMKVGKIGTAVVTKDELIEAILYYNK